MATTSTATQATTVYRVITDRILEALERGVAPWHRPWQAGQLPHSLVSRKPYRGINVFLLSMTAQAKGYTSPYWLTFRQALALGGAVRKGERGTPVVFWKFFDGPAAAPTTDGAAPAVKPSRRPPLLRYYTVFNVEQCQGIARPVDAAVAAIAPIEACERLLAAMPAPPAIRESRTDARAYYVPAQDVVNMPARALFTSPARFYATLFHELTHATGHPSRLHRATLVDASPFGTPNYSREELVAEMGAAFLCGLAGIENETVEPSAAYLQSWLRVLANDPRMLVIAAAQAQKAADYIRGARAGEDDEPAEAPAGEPVTFAAAA